MSKRGILIAVEGLDCSGKTSQCVKLNNALKNLGHDVEVVSIPMPLLTVNDRQCHLMYAQNVWQEQDGMKAKLLRGKSLIVDSYMYTSMCSKVSSVRDMAWLRSLYVQCLMPDLSVYLDTSVDEVMRRSCTAVDVLSKCKMFKDMIWADINDGHWKVVNGNDTKGTVHASLLRYALETLYSIRPEQPLYEII